MTTEEFNEHYTATMTRLEHYQRVGVASIDEARVCLVWTWSTDKRDFLQYLQDVAPQSITRHPHSIAIKDDKLITQIPHEAILNISPDTHRYKDRVQAYERTHLKSETT